MNDDAKPSTLQAFIDAIALKACDNQGPPEPELPKTPEQQIVVAGRGRRDKTA